MRFVGRGHRGGWRYLGVALLLWPFWAHAHDPELPGIPPDDVTTWAQAIDQQFAASWNEAGIAPASRCDDATLVRRLYLDLLGRIPRVSEARDFWNDPSPDRRLRLTDQLVHHPSHATRLTNLWRVFLLPMEEDPLTSANTAGFENWLRERFAANAPYDQVARELLTAEGSARDSGPALYYTSWQLRPEKLAGSTARALLGIQVQCAECHDHPFDRWSQKDFWGYAAFFSQLQPLTEDAQRGFREVLNGEVRMPQTDEIVPAKFLGGEFAHREALSRRQQLADWVTGRDNPFFARAAVNRVWFMLFGRGLVDPPDDIGRHNPSPHDELLKMLGKAFREHHYDLRWLVRTLCRTQAYQLESGKTDNTTKTESFAEMPIKVMTAEQLYDSLNVAVGQPHPEAGPTFGMNRIDNPRQLFLAGFRSPSIGVTDYRLGIAQALTLMNGTMLDVATAIDSSPLLGALEAPWFDDRQRLDILYLSVLTRLPTADERRMLQQQMTEGGTADDMREFYSDLAWVLLNSSEFVLIR